MTVCLPKGSSGLQAPIRFERPAARITAATSLTVLSLQIFQCPQCVLPRHLFEPLVDEVGVVEWASFDVGGCASSVDLIVVQWATDERARCFFDLNRSGGDAPEHDCRILDRVALEAYPS